MATWIILGNFTEQGIRHVKDTLNRAQALRDMAGKLGITVKEVYWTLGQYDTCAIVEAPDEASVTALGLSIGALGNVRTQTIRALSPDEMKGILGRLV
jgi:uncharacterized protein with GYD domain